MCVCFVCVNMCEYVYSKVAIGILGRLSGL